MQPNVFQPRARLALFCLWLSSLCFAQAQTYPVQLRFIDSETGQAIQPAVTATGGGSQQTIGVDSTGRATAQLPVGSYVVDVRSAQYRGFSGSVFVTTNSSPLEFQLDPVLAPTELRNVTALHRPDATVVVGFVVDDTTGAPLTGARVSGGGVQAYSNAKGFFQLALPLTQAGVIDVSFDKAGYQTEWHQNVQVWANGDWTFRIRLHPGSGTHLENDLHPLLSGQPTAQVNDAGEARSSIRSTVSSNATVRIPTNIRVLKSDGVTVEYVSMEMYVRRVLPSEWFSSWGTPSGGINSLKAGAVAIRSYGAWYVSNPQTSTYDICATTSCQVYGSSTSANTDNGVTNTTGYVVIDPASANKIARAEYSAENNSLANTCGDGFTAPSAGCLYDPVCTGETRNGHGRAMCQWGTAKWATGLKYPGNSTANTTTLNGQPKQDWAWIVNHYYPGYTLVQAKPLVVGDDVKAASSVTVRLCADGTISSGINCPAVTTKTAGATGVIIDGPLQVTADGSGYTWWKIQWNDTTNTVGWSVENYLERVIPAVTAPTTLTATAASSSQIQLSWTDTTSVESGFKIERANTASGPWIQVAVVAADVTTFTDANRFSAWTNYYRVRAYNVAGDSAYSNTANARTADAAPVLGSISNQTINEGSAFTFTANASASVFQVMLADFENFDTWTTNGTVLLRNPRNSTTTSTNIETTPDYASVSDIFPASANTGSRVLMVNGSVTNANTPWLRLTTGAATSLPNPVIDFTKKLQFDVYCDKSILVALGCRETTTAAGTLLGSDGGVTGTSIEWAGVASKNGAAPVPNRSVNANTWTTLTFNFPTESITSFSGGNGVLSTASGLGVLEHIAVVPNSGTNNYKMYFDNFVVSWPKTITYSLDAGAPSGATVNATSGVFTWTPTHAQAGTSYTITLRATDNGSLAQSDAKTFTITVNAAPTVSTQPTSTTNSAGTTAVFNVAATGTGPLLYQWKKAGVSLSNIGNISGANSASLTIGTVSQSDAGSYSVTITNVAGATTSLSAALAVIDPPAVTSQPNNRTNIAGTTATFAATVTGTSPVLQWRKNGIPLANSATVSGATTTTLTLANVVQADAADYSLLATNLAGTATAGPATLTVIDPAVITAQPTSRTNNAGTAATFTVLATGTSVTYQWRKNGAPLLDGDNVSGVASQSLTIAAVTASDAGTYSVLATNTANTITSSNAALTVIVPPSIITQPNDRTNISGTVATFAVTASGTSPVYQWQKNGSPVLNGGSISGATTGTLTLNNVSQADAATYSVLITNAAGTANSDSVTFTVIDPATITGQPSSRTNIVDTTATFSVTANGTAPVFQWSKDGVALEDNETFAGTMTRSLTVLSVSTNDAGNYTVVVTNVATVVTSAVAVLTVIVPPSILTQPQSATVNPGTNVSFEVVATGTAPLRYQWMFNGTNLTGATTSVYNRLNAQLAHGGDYSVMITNSAGSITSAIAILKINVSVSIATQPQRATVNQGDGVNFAVEASGTAPFNYQWRFNGIGIAGATESTFGKTNVAATDAGNYSVIVSNIAGQVTSSNALLTVIVPPTIRTNPANQFVATGSDVTFNVALNGTAPFTYQWQLDGTDILNATNASLRLMNVTTNDSGSYRVNVANPAGTATSAVAQLTVSSLTDITPPKVLFTAPAAGFRTNGSPLLVKGTATDNVRIAQVLYRVGTNDFQMPVGLTNWSTRIPLAPGTNVMFVKAIDASGNEFQTNRSFYLVVPSPITIITNGFGRVTGATNKQLLEVGRNYSLTATPTPGYVFTNWSGDISGTNTVITFRMQTNLLAQANFIPNPFIGAAGAYNGLFSEAVTAHQSSGFLALTIASNLAFSGRITLDGDGYAISGKFFVPGTARVLVPRPRQGKSTLVIDLALQFGTDRLTGTVSDGSWTANLVMYRSLFSKTNLATELMGRYTMLVPSADDSSAAPPGYGWATITVSTNGTVQMAGALADSTAISQAVPISQYGEWPFYAQAYPSKLIVTNVGTNGVSTYYTNINYRGSISGWLTLSNNPGSLSGQLSWIKTGWTNVFYPDGFTNVSEILGSLYIPPGIGVRALDLTNGLAYLERGNLSRNITNAITLKTNNLITVITANKLALSLTPANGSLKGTFAHPDNTNKITGIGGVLLQQQRIGGGTFAGTNEFGLFLLQEN